MRCDALYFCGFVLFPLVGLVVCFHFWPLQMILLHMSHACLPVHMLASMGGDYEIEMVGQERHAFKKVADVTKLPSRMVVTQTTSTVTITPS